MIIIVPFACPHMNLYTKDLKNLFKLTSIKKAGNVGTRNVVRNKGVDGSNQDRLKEVKDHE